MIRRLICLIAAALAVVMSGLAPAADPLTISGRVIDGDTVVVAGTTVRLKGVDAAELGSPYCVKRS